MPFSWLGFKMIDVPLYMSLYWNDIIHLMKPGLEIEAFDNTYPLRILLLNHFRILLRNVGFQLWCLSRNQPALIKLFLLKCKLNLKRWLKLGDMYKLYLFITSHPYNHHIVTFIQSSLFISNIQKICMKFKTWINVWNCKFFLLFFHFSFSVMKWSPMPFFFFFFSKSLMFFSMRLCHFVT